MFALKSSPVWLMTLLSCLLIGAGVQVKAELPVAERTFQTTSDTTEVYDRLLLERITVVGQPAWKTNIPGAATYVGAEQLQRQKYNDVGRVLRSVSGVNIQEEDGFGLRPNIGLRGAGSERSSKINIMEDGVLAAPAPYSAPAAYYFPNVGRIHSMEVRKGSSQIKYGPNTTGGALNLISTPIPSSLSGKAQVSLGERTSSKLYTNIGDRRGRVGYLIEATQLNDQGFKTLDGGGDTGFLVRDILGKFMIRSSPEASIYQRLEFKGGYHTERSDETYLGLTRDDFEVTPFRRYAASQMDEMNTEHTQFTVRHFVMLNSNLDLTTTIYQNNFSRAWYKLQELNTQVSGIQTGSLSSILRDPEIHETEFTYLQGADSPDNAFTVRNNSRDYLSRGVETKAGFTSHLGNTKNSVELGFRLHQDQEDRFQFEDEYRMQNGSMILTNAGIPGEQDNRIGSATAMSLYVQDSIVWSRWTFTPGMRYENIWFRNRNYGGSDLNRSGSDLNESEYIVSILLPGIGTVYQATEEVALIAGVHRGFSPPSPGSPSDTRSEESISYELGARIERDTFEAEVIGFYSDYSNLLGNDLAAYGGSGTTAQFNAGKVEIVGLEAIFTTDLAEMFNFRSVSLPFSTNYTYTKATFLSSFESTFSPWGRVNEGDEIPFIPSHQLNSSLMVDALSFTVGMNVSVQPAMRTTAGIRPVRLDTSTDSFAVIDLHGGYDILPNVNVFMNVRNLLNNQYIVSDRPAGVRPGLPRTVIGGLTLQF